MNEFENKKLWSSIELHHFRVYDDGRMIINLNNIAITFLPLSMSDVNVITTRLNVYKMFLSLEATEMNEFENRNFGPA
jgi:hypothetical protein